MLCLPSLISIELREYRSRQAEKWLPSAHCPANKTNKCIFISFPVFREETIIDLRPSMAWEKPALFIKERTVWFLCLLIWFATLTLFNICFFSVDFNLKKTLSALYQQCTSVLCNKISSHPIYYSKWNLLVLPPTKMNSQDNHPNSMEKNKTNMWVPTWVWKPRPDIAAFIFLNFYWNYFDSFIQSDWLAIF